MTDVLQPDTPTAARPTLAAGAIGGTSMTPLAAVPFGALVAVLMAKVASGLVIGDRWGWHRDELYYRVAGQHLSTGFVDFPPVTPMLARVAEALAPGNLVVLRGFAVAAGAGVVVLAALTARELGGRRRAQALAAVAVAVAPFLYGSNALFQTVSFDQLAWAMVVFTVARVVRRGDGRGWLAVGAAAGLAIETKYTALVLLAALAIGLVATRCGRRLLGAQMLGTTAGRRSLAGGGLLTALLVAPNVWWQSTHGWPSVAFFAAADSATPPLAFVAELALFNGPVGCFIAVIGAWHLGRDRRWRALAVASLAVVVLLVVTGGKSCYAAPILPLLLAAGAVRVEVWAVGRRDGGRRAVIALTVAIVVAGLAVAPMVVPVLPIETAVRAGLVEGRQDFADEVGWPELATQVAQAFRSLPADDQARTGILTANYGEAGAVSRFSAELPEPASLHATYRFWSGARPDARVVITVGIARDRLDRVCADVRELGRADNALGIDNEERGALITVCRTATSLEAVRLVLAS